MEKAAFLDELQRRLASLVEGTPAAEVQRNLKALGTFGYQTTTRQNPVYIQYIPRTIQHVRRNLERYPRFEHLRVLLARHVEELS